MSRSRTRKDALSFKRFTHRTRMARKNIRRSQWRKRKKQQRKQLTAAERKAARDARRTAKEAINDAIGKARAEVWAMAERLFEEFKYRTIRWWYDMIIVSSRKTSVEREMNRWNAFLFLKSKERENDPDAPTLKAHELSTLLREEWNAFTPQERIELTEDAVKELQEVRDMKKYSLQNVPIAAFHDSSATLDRISTEFDQLYMRTELELMVIGSRTNMSHYNRPFIYSTTPRVDEYFQLRCGMSLEQFAKGLECYLLSGIDGAVSNAHDELLKLKARAADLILTKLQEIALPDVIKKMHYKDFREFVTNRYGIVIDNWPLKNFAPPGSLSKPELTVLVNAWENESTKFRRLTPDELAAWNKTQEPSQSGEDASPAASTTDASPAQNVSSPAQNASSPAQNASSSAQNASSTAPPLPTPETSPSPSTPSPPSSSLVSTSAASSAIPPTPTPATLGPTPLNSSSTAVFAVASDALIQKKTRKKRSDAGVKRGPNARSKKRPEGHDVGTPASR